jgi:RNA polymerase sigma factor (sigma-70 family)
MTSDDMALVREYARSNSEQAFATLVSRHVNLVYSVALRQVRDPHLAEEVVQAVFIVLAKKTKSLGANTILSAWLCRTAGYVAAHALRTQRRRIAREQESYMQSTVNGSDAQVWAEIEPMLDEALGCLNGKEHAAVVLRFFEGKAFADIGAAIGTTEDTARVRVSRAVDKLRRFFSKRGMTVTAPVLTGVVAANSVQAAPAGLAASATAGIVNGAAVSGMVAGWAQSTLNTLTWLKMKLAAGIGVAAVVAAGGVLMVSAGMSKSEQLLIIPRHSVGKVVSGMTTNQVEAVLGKPDELTNGFMNYDRLYGMSIITLRTGAATVMCGGYQLKPAEFKGHTKEGIGIGSTKSEVIEKLGPPNAMAMGNSPFGGRNLILHYDELGITFTLDADKVQFMIVKLGEEDEPMLIVPKVSVGKLKGAMTTNEVEAILGKPDRWQGTTMVYERRYGIYVEESTIGLVAVSCGLRPSAPATAKQFRGKLKEGIVIGSTRDEVINALGKPYSELPMRSGKWQGVDLNYRSLGIQFVLESGKVRSMLVFLDKGFW